jgi:hypothetical protein
LFSESRRPVEREKEILEGVICRERERERERERKGERDGRRDASVLTLSHRPSRSASDSSFRRERARKKEGAQGHVGKERECTNVHPRVDPALFVASNAP